MRGWLFVALTVLLAACVTPPPTPEEQAAIFGPVPAAPSAEELGGARALYYPVWVQQPTADEMHLVYPRSAWARDVEAHVTLSCMVREGGRLACAAPGYTKGNNEFVQAALYVSTRLRVGGLDQRGEPAVGRRIDVPIHFVLR